jgi:hypothetical protein
MDSGSRVMPTEEPSKGPKDTFSGLSELEVNLLRSREKILLNILKTRRYMVINLLIY